MRHGAPGTPIIGRMLKKAVLAFFDAGNRNSDFRLPHVFNELTSLKTAVHPCTAAQAAEKRCFSAACQTSGFDPPHVRVRRVGKKCGVQSSSPKIA